MKLFLVFLYFFSNIYFVQANEDIRDLCLVEKSWYLKNNTNFFTKGFRSDRDIKHIVLHYLTVIDPLELQKLFEDNGISIHYFIFPNGELKQIINDNCIAYHAGSSYWKGEKSLNNTSIGIEILNPEPFNKDFTKAQYKTLIELLKKLKNKYKINKENIVSHSQIAIFNSDVSRDNEMEEISNLYNRKQDVSHLFNWKLLADNDLILWYNDDFLKEKLKQPVNIQFYFGDKKDEIFFIKEKLKTLGFYVKNTNNNFDIDLYMLSIIFHRKYFPQHFIYATQGLWSNLSTMVLNSLVEEKQNK